MDDSKIEMYIEIGRKDIHWYRDCQKVFESIFGKKKLELVCKLFAATSINTSLKANISLFRKALYEIEHDLPVGDYLPNIQQQLYQIRAGGELTGRKIRSFERAMRGVRSAVVVDIWLLRAFSMDKKYYRKGDETKKRRGGVRSSGASDKDYTLIENWVRAYAKEHKLQARQVSSMIWAGMRIHVSGDRETHYKDILRNTLVNLFNVI